MTVEQIEALAPHAKTIAQVSSLLRDKAVAFNWPAGSFILVTPFIAAYGLATTPLHPYTCVVMGIAMFLALLGVTTGYHRLWSHRTYEAHRAVQVFLAIIGSTAFSMSILEWCKDHRQHHKFTDTDKDPYNAKRGLWWSHLGWLLEAREHPNSDVRDLEADPLVRWQHKWNIPLGFAVGWGVPLLIAGLGWGDWRGAFYYNIVRTVIAHHIIFSINSFAHWSGDHIYAEQTPRDNVLLAIFTLGEGYHNFHHEFPNDYRNGIAWSAYDPTKWLIYLLECVGLAWELKRTPEEAIAKARTQTLIGILKRQRDKLYWGQPIESLPLYTKEQIADAISKKTLLVTMGNIVYDITEFLPLHPGGDKILRPYVGKDISKEFNGGVYQHTKSAKYILDTLRVGVLSPVVNNSSAS